MQKLSQVEFFKVCQFVGDNPDLLKGQDKVSVVRHVGLNTGIKITRHHLPRIQEALGIDWLVDSPKRREIRQSEAVRILACSVAALYRDHEREIPSDLAQLAAEGFTLEGGGE